MGWRKYRIVLLLFIIICSSCFADDAISISECKFTETGLMVNIQFSGFMMDTVSTVELQYLDSEEIIHFEESAIKVSKGSSELVLDIDATGKKILTNKEYELVIKIPGGFIVARIFIGNPVSAINEVYNFPGDAYKSVRIIIFRSFFIIGM